jgi:hypothetical protein
MLYRATGRGDLSQRPCLIALDGRQLRCGPTGNIGVATGGVPNVPAGTPVPAAPGVPADSDLTGLSPDQLVDLQRRAVEELARRLVVARAGG